MKITNRTHGGRSSDIGVLMQNVGTAYAVKRAVIDGEPITERVVTLTGEAVSRPGNVWARLGTPVRHLLNDAGFCPSADQMVIMGGPLMGFTLPWLDVPALTLALPTFYRSSFIGSAKGSSMTRLPLTILLIV